MMTTKDLLLKKFEDVIEIKSPSSPSFNPSPEFRGHGFKKRVQRLFRYKWVYVEHIGRNILEHLNPHRDVITTTFWGRELVLPNKDSNARSIRESGTIGATEQGLIRFLIKEIKADDVFYDIGSNYGFYTALAQELIPEGEVHAFEPSPRVFPYLRQLNQSGTFLNNEAVSNTIGNLTFFDSYNSNSSGKSTITAQVADKSRGYYATEIVQATTLDAYCETHRAPTIMKVDVEGAESSVLMGGQELFKRASPLIALELWSGEELAEFSLKTLELLKGMSYNPFFIRHTGDLEETTYGHLQTWVKSEQPDANLLFKRLKSK